MTANDLLTAVGIALGALAIVMAAANLLWIATQERRQTTPAGDAPKPKQLERR